MRRALDEATGMPAGVVPPPRYRVGDLARAAGISRQQIHQYTVLGLIREVERTGGNQRLYGPEVFGRLAAIRRMRAAGRPLTDIRARLAAGEAPDGEKGRDKEEGE